MQEAPIYAPQAVRFTIGGLPCFMPNGSPTDLRQLSQATKELLETYKSAVLTKPGQVGFPSCFVAGFIVFYCSSQLHFCLRGAGGLCAAAAHRT